MTGYQIEHGGMPDDIAEILAKNREKAEKIGLGIRVLQESGPAVSASIKSMAEIQNVAPVVESTHHFGTPAVSAVVSAPVIEMARPVAQPAPEQLQAAA